MNVYTFVCNKNCNLMVNFLILSQKQKTDGKLLIILKKEYMNVEFLIFRCKAKTFSSGTNVLRGSLRWLWCGLVYPSNGNFCLQPLILFPNSKARFLVTPRVMFKRQNTWSCQVSGCGIIDICTLGGVENTD